MSHHHVIVGDGLSAAEFAISRHMNHGDILTVVGLNVDQLGRGVAYARAVENAPWRYAYLLNSPSYGIGEDFTHWMIENQSRLFNKMQGRTPDWLSAGKDYIDQGDIAALNAPREIYGDFSEQRAQVGLQQLRLQG